MEKLGFCLIWVHQVKQSMNFKRIMTSLIHLRVHPNKRQKRKMFIFSLLYFWIGQKKYDVENHKNIDMFIRKILGKK